MIKTSPLWDEVRHEERIGLTRKHVRDVLEARFPGAVPAVVVERIKTEDNLDKLDRWPKLAITASLEAFQAGRD
jgi:hypothetical protein